MFISKAGKGALQRELDTFYQSVMDTDFSIRHVTKSAFSQSRKKLRPEAFLEMNDRALQTFYDQAPYLTWKQRRLLACDGSRLVLPNHNTVIEEFGQTGFGPNADSMRSLAITSLLFDPLNLVTLDAQLAPYTGSERELLQRHLAKVQSGDILLLDRGYPSKSLFFQLKAKGIDFCVRMKTEWWQEVKEFTESGKKERIVRFSLPKKDHKVLKDFPYIIEQEIECRLVSVTLDNGEKEVLCTSLTDSSTYKHKDICELYHIRWGIEECYKLFKSRAEIECFSGKTAIAVKQDFYAKVFMMTMSAILAFPIEEKVINETMNDPELKHIQKVNRTAALSYTQAITVALFLKGQAEGAIIAFDESTYNTTEIVRLGRKNSRKHRPKALYYMNYKRF